MHAVGPVNPCLHDPSPLSALASALTKALNELVSPSVQHLLPPIAQDTYLPGLSTEAGKTGAGVHGSFVFLGVPATHGMGAWSFLISPDTIFSLNSPRVHPLSRSVHLSSEFFPTPVLRHAP